MREAARGNWKRGIRDERKLEGAEATDYLLLLLPVFHSVPESEVLEVLLPLSSCRLLEHGWHSLAISGLGSPLRSSPQLNALVLLVKDPEISLMRTSTCSCRPPTSEPGKMAFSCDASSRPRINSCMALSFMSLKPIHRRESLS
ncbi:hypothetical protein C4D60_Mb08t01620 [Musa balbisiana]|uniref:Uncharacterized protein n=1 Tax=Musa balbisiana TaxID=52838 RepID=A0A4S8K0I9_MUSBA|nr:hypothetical protein C4D60_Mb08t01620 [Musa balbisiana]